MTEQLFFMGNKRSGTSLLVKLLNLHPEICTTHESDIVWILYQMQEGWPDQFECYPWDGPKGMKRTLQACGTLLRDCALNGSRPGEVFELVEEQLSCQDKPAKKRPIHKWVGDKKPVQQSDPQIRPFMQQHFPNARYLHVVRNPHAVVASKMEAARTWQVVPEFWKKPPEEILERWAVHEEWVLQAKNTETTPIFTFKFEDLCQQPVETMERVFAFLGLASFGHVADRIRKEVQPNPNRKYDGVRLQPSPRARAVMELYGYVE